MLLQWGQTNFVSPVRSDLSLSRFLVQFAVTETLPIPWNYFVARATQVCRATGAYAHVAFCAHQNLISFDKFFREGSGFFLRWAWIIRVEMFQTVVWKYLKFSIKKFNQTMVFRVQFATLGTNGIMEQTSWLVNGRRQTPKKKMVCLCQGSSLKD